MRSFGSLLTLIVGLGIGTVMAVPVSPDSDKNKIGQLIAQLGSTNFRERESANKELDAIGEHALEELRKAAKNSDMEIASRAAALITKIEQRAENARLLAPTYIELNLKDATIDDAIAELSKKSGYNIIVGGDKTKMSDRRVTLATGRVTFWKAFDMLCQKAGLVEADANTPFAADADPFLPVPPVQVQPLPIRIQPIKPINIKPIQVKPIQVKPLPAQKPAEDKPADRPAQDKPVEAPKPPQGFNAEQPAQQREEVPPQRAQPAQPAQAQPIQIAPAVMPVQGGAIGGRRPPQVGNGVLTIVVVDGKPTNAAGDFESAIRIRAVNDANLFGNYGPIPDGEVGMLLEVKPEPKIQIQQILGVKIDKAVDNHDQVLSATMVSGIIGGSADLDIQQRIQLKQLQIQAQGQVQVQIGGRAAPYNPNGTYYGNSYVPARLKKGEKDPKSLKEVRGTVTVKMRTGIEELAAVENILKAKGQTVKGKGETTLKIVDVSEAVNGEITLQVELQFSNEVQPQPGQRGPVQQPLPANGGIRIQVAPAQAVPPAPIPPPQNAPNANGAAVAPAVYNALGLDLLDARGQGLQLIRMTTRNQYVGTQRTASATIVFKPQKDQEGAKLVFRGSRAATIDVPFLLKDVVLK